MRRLLWKATMLLCLVGGFIACKNPDFEPAESFDFEVVRPNRDSLFVVSTTKSPFSMRINLEGNLSHIAALSWSSDSIFVINGGIGIPAGRFTSPLISSEDYTDKVFVMYKALSDSTRGNLKIKVTVQ
ncbi:hypothetical protein [Dyadobacter psychrotolerans]|uniref:DUF1735 domain-containing protein n=1 Tax=Dyadobacter psychrotolerans TaxID=2541721 RepID=A0A4R5DC96_9BACT|nr:hypothetical protein [Dyadobacter psychrotolerans]TDE10577.1 hypothetical protein E0F88_28275 [Dyadobacter psychrotolerans]